MSTEFDSNSNVRSLVDCKIDLGGWRYDLDRNVEAMVTPPYRPSSTSTFYYS